jgi:cell division protein FtsW (lipid II flippase)
LNPAQTPAPARRRTELGLLVLALVLTGGLYILAGFGKAGDLPANVVPFLFIVFALLVALHIAVRRLAPNADPILVPVAALLNGIGYVFIARLSTTAGAPAHQADLQAVWILVGVVAFVGTLLLVRRVRDLERFRYTFAFVGIGMLLLPLVPGIGENINGARLWIHLASFNFQPGELAKLALAFFFASVMVERADLLSRGTRRIGRFMVLEPRYLAPIAAAWALSLVIFLAENDLGSSFLFFALFIGMLWVATGRAWYLALGVGLFALGAVLALKVIGHAQSRIQDWLNPWPYFNSPGGSYQIIHGWFETSGGGLWGIGPGQSNVSFKILPEASSDMIFTVIAGEIGLIGAAAVLIGYMLLVGTGLRVAVRCQNPFEKLLAAGLSLVVGVQTFVIVGGVTRLIPLTGITLPFISYGGSSLIANYILLALLVRISHDVEAPVLVDAAAGQMVPV